jgi:VanZ family protein
MRLVKLWLPMILWTVVILWASDDRFSSGHSRGWLSWMTGQEVGYGLNIAIRKLGHLIAYGILGALAWRADRRAFIALAIALLVASTDEWRQSHTLTRTGTPWDVLLDVAGSWLGIVAAQRIVKRFATRIAAP